MSIWKEECVDDKIAESLRELNAVGDNFVTAYQLAIQFAKDHGEVVDKLDLKIGGEGTGERQSLASYLAREIRRHKRAGDMGEVDMAFLSNKCIEDIYFKDGEGETFKSSIKGGDKEISMFRLKK